MDFAKNLQTLRKHANLSQENVAEQLHISRQAISKWEMGQSTPDIDTCIKLCEVLKVTPDQLLLGSEKEDQYKKAVNVPKDQFTTYFVTISVFLMVICACGTVMLVCNLYNGEIFEPNVHTRAVFMIRGAMLGFIVLLLYAFRRKRGKKTEKETSQK